MQLPIQQYLDLLSRYLRPQRNRVLLLTVLLFGGIALQLWTPQIIRRFIDAAMSINEAAALNGGNPDVGSGMVGADAVGAGLLQMGILYLAVTLFAQVVRTATAYVTEDVKWRATNWLRNDLSAHCLQLDMGFHNDNTPGKMIERIDGDVTQLSNFLSQFVLRLLGNSVLLISVIVLLYREDWRFGVAFTLFAVVMFVSLLRSVNFSVGYWKQLRESASEMFGRIEEWLGGMEDLRANGGTGYVMERLSRTIYKIYLASRSAFVLGSLTWGMNTLFGAISMALALGVGAYLLQLDAITIGTVYLALHYSTSLQQPLQQLARELQDLQNSTASITRIVELFETQPIVKESTIPDTLPVFAHTMSTHPGGLSIDFEDVTFSYVAHEQQADPDTAQDAEHEIVAPILNNLNFHLGAGKVLGLLGRTGSGKTTITRLLFRLYDPTAGTIWINDRDIRTLSLSDLRSHIGMVTQEVQLFQASVRDNLTFFDDSIDDEKILDTLDMLGLGAWIAGLDDGLDTRLASGGRSLSAGEAQLLAFARVFLKDPGLVILDEASSRLDPVTEQLIEQAIDRLLEGRTAIIVAHRLATVQRADEIMVLQDGEIVEHGERVALLADSDSWFAALMRAGVGECVSA
ncbi:MAG: ABC transporter ATP-binding protein [Chloroflexota bacterium]